MDPKLSGLDPKLKEAYDRVMNGPSTPPPSQPAQSTPTPAPIQTPHEQMPANPLVNPIPGMPAAVPPPPPNPIVQPPPPIMPASNPMPAAPTPPAQAAPLSSSGINSTVAYNAHNSSVNKGTSDTKHGGGMGKIIMFALVVLIFFVIYTFVWVYLFHLKLPFIG